jgi:hypothetical protein
MKKIKSSLIVLTLALLCLASTCRRSQQGEVNNTANNGTVATECNTGAIVSMMGATIIISERTSIECGKTFSTMTTAIVARDDDQSLAGICTQKLFAELYYSRTQTGLNLLTSIATDSMEDMMDLPIGVGRLVQARSLPENPTNTNYIIPEPLSNSPNRLVFKVQFPPFIADFNIRNTTPNSSNFRTGETIYYRWGKRIQRLGPGAEGVDVKMLSPLYSISYQEPNNINAGNDKVITLPQERSVILDGSVVNNRSTLQSIEWKWVRQNQGPNDAPTIISPNTPITEVIFNDYGIHNFEMTASDNCGNSFRDVVSITVRGQLVDNVGNKCNIQSNGSCANGNFGRRMFLKNTSNDRISVKLKVTNDLRSWYNIASSGNGTLFYTEQTLILNGNEEYFLGCNIINGNAPVNGTDIGYYTWTIISETRL